MSELNRDTVLALLASYHDRSPEAMGENVGSLDLAWLIHTVEEQYGTRLYLDDEALDKMRTVSDAVAVLNDALAHADRA